VAPKITKPSLGAIAPFIPNDGPSSPIDLEWRESSQVQPTPIRNWIAGVSAATIAAGFAYLASHACNEAARVAASAAFATGSGLTWVLSSVLMRTPVISARLSLTAAALAALSGVCLLP
jgi:hypothetical protein